MRIVLEAPADCGKKIQIREVWDDNLEAEYKLIRESVDDFPFIALYTHHTGNVFCPAPGVETNGDYKYHMHKANIDSGKLIQVGLTFFDKVGDTPTFDTGGPCVWQFNFRGFDPKRDVYQKNAIEPLLQAGIDFKKHTENGIDAIKFAELLMSSGAVLEDSVQWVAFDGVYDFGHLLKPLTGKSLPDTKAEFLRLANTFFRTTYDLKHLMKCRGVHNWGLKKLARKKVVGIPRQAGLYSFLTSAKFRKERRFYGDGEQYAGVLSGLEVEED